MTAKQRQIKILCVDDHSFLIDGLRARFETETDLEFVGSLLSAEGLVAEVKRSEAEIVLVDIEMPGPDPFESIDDLRHQCPNARSIILSAHLRDHYISAAINAGAWGYFCKSDDAADIIDGIRSVSRGQFAFGPKVQERCQPVIGSNSGQFVPPKSRIDTLTTREQEVLRLIGRGHTRSEIAELLHRSPKTIDGHREAIMNKLDIHDRGELVRFALREGLAEL